MTKNVKYLNTSPRLKPRKRKIIIGLFLVLLILLWTSTGVSTSQHEVEGSTSKRDQRIAVLMLQIPQSTKVTEDESQKNVLHAEAIANANEYCIDSHRKYCAKHQYAFYLETKNYVGRLPYWQKIFSLIRLMTEALEKETLDWIFWTDVDTLVLNDEVRLESFLPPHVDNWTTDSEVHVLMSRDHRGWNNGAFIIRVCPWSLAYLVRTFTWPDYRPHFDSLEQTAMARLYEEYADVRQHVVRVPMRWFNAYPSGRSVYVAQDMDLHIHFPGSSNKNLMVQSIENVKNKRQYRQDVPYVGNGTTLEEDLMTASEFWQNVIRGDIERGNLYPHQ